MNRIVEYVESSFLKDLLSCETITDISFNGESIFFEDINLGRKKPDIKISKQDAIDFARQIANLSESSFSYSSPILDISAGKYRLNFVHNAITKLGDEKTISFSIRIASTKLRISGNDEFMDKEVNDFLMKVIKKKLSIVIGGKTSSGKTELQKYLISKIDNYGRVIVIDNVDEIEIIRNQDQLDLTFWQVNNQVNGGDFESLIKNAVRNNPDWLVVAEARSREMSSVLNSVMTGHPILTTIHAKDIESMPARMTRMVMLQDKSSTYQEIFDDIIYHFPIFIYLEKIITKSGVKRRIKTIAEFCLENKRMSIIYDANAKTKNLKISNKLKEELQDE